VIVIVSVPSAWLARSKTATVGACASVSVIVSVYECDKCVVGENQSSSAALTQSRP
jgi:hypothetical protein